MKSTVLSGQDIASLQEKFARYGFSGLLNDKSVASIFMKRFFQEDQGLEVRIDNYRKLLLEVIAMGKDSYLTTSQKEELGTLTSDILKLKRLATYRDFYLEHPEQGSIGDFYDLLGYPHSTGDKTVRLGHQNQNFKRRSL